MEESEGFNVKKLKRCSLSLDLFRCPVAAFRRRHVFSSAYNVCVQQYGPALNAKKKEEKRPRNATRGHDHTRRHDSCCEKRKRSNTH